MDSNCSRFTILQTTLTWWLNGDSLFSPLPIRLLICQYCYRPGLYVCAARPRYSVGSVEYFAVHWTFHITTYFMWLRSLIYTTDCGHIACRIKSAIRCLCVYVTLSFIIRPHRAAYCYWRVAPCVCLSVCLCACVSVRSVTRMCPAKTAGPTEMPFGMWGGVGDSQHVLDGGPDPPWEEAILGWGRGRPIAKYRDNGVWALKRWVWWRWR